MRSLITILVIFTYFIGFCGCAHAAPSGFFSLYAAPRAPANWALPEASKITTIAVKIDDHYLLTTTAGMPPAVRSFWDDPTVFVFDGSRLRRGRYVDYHASFGIALVHVEEALPGPTFTVVSAPSDATVKKNTFGYGAIFTDRQGRIVGIAGRQLRDFRLGAEIIEERGDGSMIMDFLRTYFATGGLRVDPKPAFIPKPNPPPDGGEQAPAPH